MAGSSPCPRLGPRLAAVAQLVPRGRSVADLGCDHGHLSVHLARTGAGRVIATDLRPAPLERARRALARAAPLPCPVEVRLGEGLAPILDGEVHVAVMAGVGAGAMAQVLAQARARGVERLVLQPNEGCSELRVRLADRGWRIVDERLAAERCRRGRRIYTVLAAEPGAGAPLSHEDALLGPVLRRRRPPLFAEWVRRERARLEAAARAVARGGAPMPPGLATDLAVLRRGQGASGP